MTKIRLRVWLLLCSLLPALLLSVFSGGYFSYVRYHELQLSLTEQARQIAIPLAITTASLLASNNQQDLQKLIDTSHRYNSASLNSIAIVNLQNKLLYNSNPQFNAATLPLTQPDQLAEHGFFNETTSNLLFYHPLTTTQNGQQTNLGYLILNLHKDQLQLRQQNYILYLVLILILCLLICCTPAFYILQRLYHPIREMNKQLQQLIDHDELKNTPLIKCNSPLITAKELHEMQQGLQQLSAQIVSQEQEMQQQIDQANSDLQQTLEQLEVHNVQLDFARRKALEENRQKSEFLAKMSHELRTPLNGVIGFTRQVLKTQLTNNQHDYLMTIQKSANSLLHLVNDVLDFSKLEEGRLSINSEPFSLRELLNDATELLAANAFDKYLELVLIIAPECPDDIIADPKRFSQVLINIAGNAIKFTDHGSIVIRVNCNYLSDGQIMLHCSVQDTGRGIHPEQQKQLFHGFGSSESSSHQSGSGLGLMISQRLVKAMGGKIGFESAQAEGSTFWFTIKCNHHQLSIAETLPIAVLEQKSVLYFEPQQYSREAMLQLLQSWHLNVTTCSTLAQLQSALKNQQHYDIAIIGKAIAINQVNHIISVMQQVKPYCDYTYLLINTLSPSIREILLNAGADACLSKPAHFNKLAMMLASPYLQHKAPVTQAELPTKAALKVLTVDDNEANLKLINTLLAEQVEHIESACDGAEAWHKATQHLYDIIFLDINMPIMDGISACQRIRQSSLNEHTPIIAVTAHTADGERERLIMLGFDEFLSKPLDEKMLQYILQEFCQQKLNTAPSNVNPTVSWPPSKIVDWPLALEQANGKVNLMQDMLAMLVASIKPTQEAIANAIKQQDSEALLHQIHKLHGGCCYTGIPLLKRLAETIETSLKQQVSLQKLEPELFELDDLLNTLWHEYQQWPETFSV
ncbi:two-component sensor histidine kinase BarA [Rheinheimera sp. MMS21-TC3]|uniref:two-component sensor histidine kinase BarA n=1 Tax=Rheinheimera sp. MMS21-TC3 TaxID=3072790 RepID=UPI0028C3A456|nr:two-component sensor histidine kinase BarA [Rheinheimera sp. MMS21-TC3]WNO61572.1 two-component sensor histidine kinase BarA [Rheinheimera sp. MMS21-TC3]